MVTHPDPIVLIGNERYLLETMDVRDAEEYARRYGWDGDPETLLDHCDAGRAVVKVQVFKTFDEALKAAREHMATGESLFGAADIDHERYEQAHDDRGNRVKGGSWERVRAWEVANGPDDVMEVEICASAAC